jgi:hypothetical protein
VRPSGRDASQRKIDSWIAGCVDKGVEQMQVLVGSHDCEQRLPIALPLLGEMAEERLRAAPLISGSARQRRPEHLRQHVGIADLPERGAESLQIRS